MASDNSDVIKHLELIQGIVNRMAGNSFLIKGWSLTVASAFLAIAVQTRCRWYVALALIPLFGFWALDAYYLRRERLFRKLYDEVRKPMADKSKPTAVDPFCMDTRPYFDDVHSLWRTLRSGVTLGLYLPMLIVLAIVAALIPI